ncbi:N-acyl homoserine lactonase family protein [Actinomadura sp. LOL_016]|uniref:N-acyl homoserine lactonase family protein n=1 Tax=Actinomadura sp. LOL_016 TaxID=3345411 RepID=UPI003A8893F9
MGERSTLPAWEVYALRLGSVDRPAQDNFLMPCARTGAMRLDFTMWLARRGDRAVVIDTGFSEPAGTRRGRRLDLRPAEAVRRAGTEPAKVDHVVLTHLHYDHAGNIGDFPGARVAVQADELAFTTGKPMTHPALNHFYEPEDVADVVRRVHAGDVRVVEGDVELAPGLELHLIGGHTRGLQVVRVHTGRGWVVLASDALHYYANFQERNPFPAILDLGRLLDGYERLGELASGPDHIVPGHDPEVFDRYADPRAGLPEGVVALHEAPATASAH